MPQAPPPVPAPVHRKGRSLGTMAMAQPQQEQRFDTSDSSDNDSLKLNEPRSVPELRFYPPPTAFGEKRKKVLVREAPRPVERLPEIVIPPPPPIPEDSVSPRIKSPLSPLSPLLARARSKRRTIMERIEGWWDLDLFEKRATLFGNGSAAPRKG